MASTSPPSLHSSISLPSPPSLSPSPGPSRAIPLLLPIVILFFLLLCVLSFFLFRDLLHVAQALLRGGTPSAHRPNDARAHGLDPTIIASFPTLPYSLVRGLQEGKCGAECAVCLAEFSGGDVIRLLTVCCHAFHQPCIDSWLAAHATCPVCRSDLEAPPDEAAVKAVREAVDGGGVANESHVIDVDQKEEEGQSEKPSPVRREDVEEGGTR